MPVGPNGTSIILPASWISEADMISLSDADLSWDEKPADAHFIVASRLVREKGIPLLIDALMNLEGKGETISVDVMGSGAMKADLEGIAGKLRNVRLRLLDPVPYGPSFMRALRQYHAVIVPVTGDEQARILYDAFSQAIPIIAANTAGNREVVTHGGTGFLFEADNPAALSETLCHCADDLDGLRQAGLSALTVAAKHTHADMHGKRAEFLRETFGEC
ncbi:glycosyltransferase [Paracoccus endophyticus]|uniref:glycosyltransferase n=1 Tax=Paracoccus endophyticus TaxID=2233774 RepID=UPI0013A6B111|nr:glycosyltransferase [Paracoccus endophyticus]